MERHGGTGPTQRQCLRRTGSQRGGEGRAYKGEGAGRSTKYGETCRVNEPSRRVTERDDARGTRRHLYRAIALSVLESTVWEEVRVRSGRVAGGAGARGISGDSTHGESWNGADRACWLHGRQLPAGLPPPRIIPDVGATEMDIAIGGKREGDIERQDRATERGRGKR